MKTRMKLPLSINEYEYALFSGQALAECRSISALIKYAAIQYCLAYPAKVDTKKIFTKFVPQVRKFDEDI